MTTNADQHQHRAILRDIARKVMLARGLQPDFSAEVLAELNRLRVPATTRSKSIRDLRALPWCSIDNDDSRDLDQLTVAEQLTDGNVRILVAVADVDALVKTGGPIDGHAGTNTTTVYTPAMIFPMLPEKLSTDLTSLALGENRISIVIDMVIASNGTLQDIDIYQARVHNHAKLAYNGVAAWLEGLEPVPCEITSVDGLEENLRLQDEVARRMKANRHMHGALSLETIEARPVFDGDEILDLEGVKRNCAMELIEDFMIAANVSVARYLSASNSAYIRRVVRTPKRWDRIVEIARDLGTALLDTPDPKALDDFLVTQKATDPLGFPDLCLAIIKLLGAGEYVVELPGGQAPGHFVLAVNEYAHATGPNRRYTDLVTQRLLKAAIDGTPPPYANDELEALAARCTELGSLAKKIERQVEKSAAALLLEPRVGEQFDAIVTGAAPKGTWVRLIDMPIEGKLVEGFEGVDVGNRVRVQLESVDVWQGFIDFRNVR
jgi:exoribonuclease-2